MINKVFNEDCLIGMQRIPDKSIDMILCDLPYGTTACKWDTIIPFEPLWAHYERIIKENGAIVLFGRNPFFSKLICSNEKLFRYEIVWDKNAGTDFAQANNKPITVHENIGVFSKNKVKYNRIDDDGFKPYSDKRTIKQSSELGAKGLTNREPFENKTTRTPTTIRRYFPDNRKGLGSSLHPTQKPLSLIEWLVKSYSSEGDIILDNCMGSGTTAVACINTNRNYIGFEMDKTYFDIINKRISDMPKPNKITNPSGVTKELWNWELHELKLKFEASSAYISWKGTDLGKNVDLFLNDMGYKIEVEAAL